MRYLSLVWVNLTRNKRRTVLTMLSVAVALFLFSSLRTVLTTLKDATRVGSESRMVVRNAISLVFPLPMAYRGRLESVPGVRTVSWGNWFGGIYIDERNFFAQFAVDAETYLPMYPEALIPEDQKQAFLEERTAAIVGQRLIERFGWKLGQTITLQGTIYPGEWPFVIRGVYRAADPSFGEEAMLFHYGYLYEKTGQRAQPNWFILQLSDPALAPQVAVTVDEMFRNSSAATKTETEKAFQAGFIGMYGNIGFLINAIGMAVVFAILLVAANTMMMAARERTNEVAVLKTLGYGDGLLFRLMLFEAAGITLVGGLLGVLGAKLLYEVTGFQAGGILPGFNLKWTTIGLGLGMALLLGLVSGFVPAWQAARLPVVQALRRVQ